MAGQASGGQALKPNPNVNAPAGFGGGKWGANGGGIVPIGNGLTGILGWDAPIKATLCDSETADNYQTAKIALQVQQSTGALKNATFDDSLPSGGGNSG